LNNNDITLAIYVFFILIVLFISYKYASYMIKNTGLFLAYSFIASMINLTLLLNFRTWISFCLVEMTDVMAISFCSLTKHILKEKTPRSVVQ